MAETHTNKGNQGQSFGNANKGGQQQNQGHGQGQNQGNANRGGQNQNQGSQGGQGHEGGQGMTGVAQMAKDAASTATKMATDQAQHAAENIAGGIRSFAGTIRDHAPEGMLGTAAGSVADTLESGGRYLEQEGFSGMAEDVVGMVRRYPVPSMLVCAALGFCLGRMLTSSHNTGSF
jgi:hypothetical protein